MLSNPQIIGTVALIMTFMVLSGGLYYIKHFDKRVKQPTL